MPESAFFVFSEPPSHVDRADYGLWYEGHVRDILAVDGFRAARRFDLQPVRGDTSPTMYSHLSLYAIEGDPREAMARLSAEVEEGRVPLPDFFGEIRFASFYADPLEGPIDLATLDHAYLVFSKQPAQIPLDDYIEWYATHARENLTAEGFEHVWRYRLHPDSVDPLAPPESVHAAVYEVHGELPELRLALKEAADAGRVGFPDWFGEILFASMDAYAASPALAGVAA